MNKEELTNTRFGIYVRTACREDLSDEHNCIQNQLTLSTDYLLKHNLIKVNEFIDNGYSGMDMKRPAFSRLLEAIRNKEIDGIIIKDLSCLGRNRHKLSKFFADCKENHIRVISIFNQLDTKDNLIDDKFLFL